MAASRKEGYRAGTFDISSSGWLSFPGEVAEFETLAGEHRADVVVVGAGLAGSSLALHLAEGGANTLVVDANEPGWGASGRNAGHVAGHRGLMPSIRQLPDGGEAFLDLWRRELRLPFRLAEKHGIVCDAVNGGMLKAVRGAKGIEAAHRYAEEFAALGLPLRFIDREETIRFTGSEAFDGGALDEAGGRINPYHFTRGLALAAREAGAGVFAHSPVLHIHRSGDRWQVVTNYGTISAERVVLCTGAYGDIPEAPAVRESWYPLLAYVLATKPLPEAVRATILPTGGTCTTIPEGMNPWMIDGLGRLITSLLPAPRAEDVGPLRPRLRRWVDRIYPAMAGVPLEIDSYWTGLMAYSTDHLPYVSELGPGMLMLNGFASQGNAPAPLMGKHLAEKLLAGALHELAIPLRPAPSLRWRGRQDFFMRRMLVPLGHLATRMGIVG